MRSLFHALAQLTTRRISYSTAPFATVEIGGAYSLVGKAHKRTLKHYKFDDANPATVLLLLGQFKMI